MAYAHVSRAAAQPLSGIPEVLASFDTQVNTPPVGWVDLQNNPTRVTVATSGEYFVFGEVYLRQPFAGFVTVKLLVNGSESGQQQTRKVDGFGSVSLGVPALTLSANDYMELLVINPACQDAEIVSAQLQVVANINSTKRVAELGYEEAQATPGMILATGTSGNIIPMNTGNGDGWITVDADGSFTPSVDCIAHWEVNLYAYGTTASLCMVDIVPYAATVPNKPVVNLLTTVNVRMSTGVKKLTANTRYALKAWTNQANQLRAGYASTLNPAGTERHATLTFQEL